MFQSATPTHVYPEGIGRGHNVGLTQVSIGLYLRGCLYYVTLILPHLHHAVCYAELYDILITHTLSLELNTDVDYTGLCVFLSAPV